MSMHTSGPWYPGHLCDDTTTCNCRYIFGGSHEGAIGEVYVDNGKKLISEGWNDCPPIDEAKANQRLMSAAPDLLKALETMVALLATVTVMDAGGWYPETEPEMIAARDAIRKAIEGVPL